jgi:hypothetical protein
MSRVVFIIDIDITIANNDHRAVHLRSSCGSCGRTIPVEERGPCTSCGSHEVSIPQESWDNFLDPDLILQDQVVPGAKRTIDLFRKFGFEFHFITGRNGTKLLRADATRKWLSEKLDWNPDKELLMMRTLEDNERPASVYKQHAFQRLLNIKQYQDDVNFIFFEDDHFVFNTYSKYGIVVESPGCWEYFVPNGATGEEAVWRR